MSLTKEKKQELMEKYGQHEDDNGSAEVQIAILTERISNITEHLEDHKHDNSSRRGLKTLVNRRRKLLDYLKDNDEEKYKELISELGIRK